MGFLSACSSADIEFDLMVDTGSAINPDATAAMPDTGPGDMGVIPSDAGFADTGTSTATPEDAGFPDSGTSTVTPDAGFAPDAVVPDDAGFAPDAVVPPDAGFAPDAIVPPDAGFAPDAIAPPDVGFAPDIGFAPDAAPVDAGVVTTQMSFFVTSRRVEVGGVAVTGGNLGGLSGADAFCVTLAREADATDNRTWRAFLSSSTTDARDRIGSGPWYNANNQLIASTVTGLISSPPPENLMLDEQGRAWNGASSTRHDILTGSNHDGRRFNSLAEMTSGNPNPNGSLFYFPDGSFNYTNPAFDFSCNDWTSDSINDYAVVGHVDWDILTTGIGTGGDEWTTSHVSACNETEMVLNAGDIRLYCFVQN